MMSRVNEEEEYDSNNLETSMKKQNTIIQKGKPKEKKESQIKLKMNQVRRKMMSITSKKTFIQKMLTTSGSPSGDDRRDTVTED